jgi:cell division septation protein DedD
MAKPADAPPPALVPAAPAPATPEPPPAAPPTPRPPTGPTPAPRSATEKTAPAARKQTAEKPAVERPAAGTPAAGKPSGDKAAPLSKVARAPEPTARPTTPAAPKVDGSSAGGYWVQLGAFKEQKNAETLAKTLRDQGVPVEVSRIARSSGEARGAPQQHELFVTEAGVERVNAALKGRGSAQPAPGGVTVRPAFDLEEAMAISKRLTDQGLKVIIRPAGGGGGTGGGTLTLHVVRAGGYPDRARALAAREELSARGHGAGIVTQGPAR